MKRYPLLIGLGTFMLGTAIAVLLFAVLDVDWILLFAPVVGIGCAAYAAFRTAQRDVPPDGGGTRRRAGGHRRAAR